MHVENSGLRVPLKCGRGQKKMEKKWRGALFEATIWPKRAPWKSLFWDDDNYQNWKVGTDQLHIDIFGGQADWPAFIWCLVGKVCIVWPCPRLTDQALANHNNTQSVACYRGLPSPGNVDVFVMRLSKFVMASTNLLSGTRNASKTHA